MGRPIRAFWLLVFVLLGASVFFGLSAEARRQKLRGGGMSVQAAGAGPLAAPGADGSRDR